jgi:hypothetical protein
MIIRAEQMETFKAATRRGFETEVLGHIKREFPRAAAQLAEFEKDKEPEHLQTAAGLLAEVDLSKEKEGLKRLALRRETLRLWLSLLAAIDKNLDPAFNPDDVPAVSVEPPPAGRRATSRSVSAPRFQTMRTR